MTSMNTVKLHGCKAVISARVSTSAEEQDSLPSQIGISRRVAEQLGLEVPDDYVCVDQMSRSLWPRPGMARALMLIEDDPEIAALIVWEGKRAYGDATQQKLIFDHCRRHRVRIFDGSGRELNQQSVAGFIVDGVDSLMAQLEVVITRQRVRDTHLEKFRSENKWLLSPAFGFKAIPLLDDDGDVVYRKKKIQKKIIIDEPAMAIVRQMFEWAGNERLTAYQITERLREMGIATPRGAERWQNTQVLRTLRNRIYIGEMWWNRTEVERVGAKKRKLKRDEDEWEVRPSPFGVVIGSDPDDGVALFDRANAELAARSHTRMAIKRNYGPFDGLVHCNRCKYSMTRIQRGHKNAQGERRNTFVFRCAGRRNGKHACEKDHGYPQLRLMSQLRWLADHYGETSEYEISMEVKLPIHRVTDDQLRLAEDAVTKAQSALTRAREAYDGGVDTLAEYGENKQRLSQAFDEAVARRDALRTPVDTEIPQSVIMSIRKALSRLMDLIENEELPIAKRQAAARELIDGIWLDNPNMHIVFRTPFQEAVANARDDRQTVAA